MKQRNWASKTELSGTLTLRTTKERIQWLHDLAYQRRISTNALLNDIISDYFGNTEPKEKLSKVNP